MNEPVRHLSILHRRGRGEDGSLPMVLLAAIVMAGIVAILFGQVRTAQNSVLNDRDFHQAIQYADTGAQAAFTFLARNEPLAEQLLNDFGVDDVISSDDLPPQFESQVGHGEYRWQAKKIGERRWEIRSVGTANGVERVTEIETSPLPLFGAALYGEEFIGGQYVGNFTSGNAPSWQTGQYADGTGAYNGGTGEVDDDSDIVAGTGANCNLTGPNSDEFVQTIFTDEGDGSETYGCQDRAAARNFPDIAARAFSDGGVCRLANEDLGSLSVVGNDPAGSHPDYLPEAGSEIVLERGTTYCYNNMAWPSSHRLTVSDGDGAVRVYVKGTLTVSGNGSSSRKQINVDDIDGPPDASALQLMFAGNPADGGINITHQNHVWVAAAIYAPNRACEVNTQTKLWGAMICNTFEIGASGGGGGFNFWWDTSVADIFSDDDVAIRSSREEFPGSTGFDWVTP